jgi:hypothetical chaperone protein
VSLTGIGLDFGTTNSSVAVVRDDQVALATFDGGTAAYRSVLFFDPYERGRDRRPLSVAGPPAIARYLEAEGDGRLIQSIKSYLASRTFQATSIFGFTYTLEDLVARLLEHLAADAPATVGPLAGAPIVVGRPVRLAGAETAEDEAVALARLRRALERAGVGEVVLEYEPVGAAYHYERRLDHDELVLIADFGGGTSDFCLARVGPGARAGDRILGTEGVPLAGDAFDRQIVRRIVAPALGKGSGYVSHGKPMPVPPWLYGHLERWHHLSFLKSRATMKLLHDVLDGADAPDRIAALLHLVESDLGYALYRAVEQTKIELSHAPSSRLVFREGPIDLDAEVRRDDFEGWIADELGAIAAAVDRLLAAAGVDARAVDRVFTTGGSSLVPAVRAIFTGRFGAARLAAGDELTSVASGLALRAADLRR